jgi:hypothetical protein
MVKGFFAPIFFSRSYARGQAATLSHLYTSTMSCGGRAAEAWLPAVSEREPGQDASSRVSCGGRVILARPKRRRKQRLPSTRRRPQTQRCLLVIGPGFGLKFALGCQMAQKQRMRSAMHKHGNSNERWAIAIRNAIRLQSLHSCCAHGNVSMARQSPCQCHPAARSCSWLGNCSCNLDKASPLSRDLSLRDCCASDSNRVNVRSEVSVANVNEELFRCAPCQRRMPLAC